MTSPNLPAAEQLEQVTGPSLNELSAMAPWWAAFSGKQ